MRGARISARRPPLHLLALGVGGIGMTLGLAISLGNSWWQSLPALPQLVLAALFYSASHLIRVMRSVALLGGASRSIRAIAAAHLVTAIWSGFIPLKLGELLRLYALGRASGSLVRGLAVIWIERAFDAVLLVMAAGLALLLVPTATTQIAPILVLSLLLLGGTWVAITALPENLVALKHWVIRRYTHPRALTTLAALDGLLAGVRMMRTLVSGKVATLGVLTGLIWTLESLALWVITARDHHLLVALLAILSDVLQPDQALHDDLLPAIASWQAVVFLILTAMAPLGLWLGAHGGARASVHYRRS